MIKVYKSVMIVLFILFAHQSQSATWERLHSKKSTDCFRNVKEVPAGGFVVAGYSANLTPNDTDGIIIRFNDNGDTLWTFTYNGPNSKEDCFYKVVPTSDGGFVVCGYSRSFGGGDNAMILKLNSSGHLQWVEDWGGSGTERAQDIIELSNGKFVVVGYTTSSPAHYYDAFILKLDESGSTMWSKVYGWNNYDDANSVKVLPDGGFIMGGQSNNNLFLIRTNSSGDTLWTKVWGTSGIDNIECVNYAQGSGNGFIISGSTDGPGSGGDDGYVVKTDSGGNQLWAKTYGGSLNDDYHRIELTNDGGYFASGTSSDGPWADPNIWVTKIDASGNVAWDNYFGGPHHDHGYGGTPTSDGGYIVVGHSHSFNDDDFLEEGLVVKMNSSGQVTNKLDYTTVSDFDFPSSSTCGSSNVFIELEVTNFSDQTVTSIPVTVEITGAITQTVTATYNSSVNRDASKTLTFTTPIDMSMGGTFNFHCYTTNPHDVFPARNYFNKTITVGVTSSTPTVTNGTHCGPAAIALSATSPDQIKWYAASSGGSSLATGSNFTTPYITSTTTYYVQAGSTCPSARVPITATITAGLTAPTATDASRCGDGTVTLSAAGSNTIKWYDTSNSTTILASGTSYVTPTLTSSSTYYVSSETATCASTRVAVHANVNPLPADPVVVNSGVCGSGTVSLSATAADPVSWYAAASGGSSLATGTAYTTPVLSSTITYYVQASNANCTSSRVPIVASIYTIPSLPVIDNGFSCGSGVITLTATSSDMISWYNTPTGGSPLDSGLSFSSPVLSSSTVYYAMASNANCSSSRVAVNADIFTPPTISLGLDTVLSSGNPVLLDAGTGFVSYLWSNSVTTQTMSAAVSGNYCVTVTDANGCTTSDCSFIDINVGINDIRISSASIYPNPAKGYVTVELQKDGIENNLEVLDMTGKVVFAKSIAKKEMINLTSLSKGIYIIRINNQYQSSAQRIVID